MIRLFSNELPEDHASLNSYQEALSDPSLSSILDPLSLRATGLTHRPDCLLKLYLVKLWTAKVTQTQVLNESCACTQIAESAELPSVTDSKPFPCSNGLISFSSAQKFRIRNKNVKNLLLAHQNKLNLANCTTKSNESKLGIPTAALFSPPVDSPTALSCLVHCHSL